tara:strand:+ start:189 stop:509 length:321 start_codon:yes stop_codon:yes gene_type:complete
MRTTNPKIKFTNDTHKHVRLTTKIETRVTKHTLYEYEYKLEYVAYYDKGMLRGISKHERKFFDVSVQGSAELRGGTYIKPIMKTTPLYKTLTELFSVINEDTTVIL